MACDVEYEYEYRCAEYEHEHEHEHEWIVKRSPFCESLLTESLIRKTPQRKPSIAPAGPLCDLRELRVKSPPKTKTFADLKTLHPCRGGAIVERECWESQPSGTGQPLGLAFSARRSACRHV